MELKDATTEEDTPQFDQFYEQITNKEMDAICFELSQRLWQKHAFANQQTNTNNKTILHRLPNSSPVQGQKQQCHE